jgi:outer membrane protein TolC
VFSDIVRRFNGDPTLLRGWRKAMHEKGLSLLVILFLWVLAAASPNPAVAEDDLSDAAISLEEAIRIALERNQDVLIAEQRLLESRRALAESRAAFFPTLAAVAGYQRIDESPSFEVPMFGEVDFMPTESYQAGFVAEQPVYTGGRLVYAHAMARSGVRSSTEQRQAVYNELVFRVKEAYYSILLAQRYADVAEQSVKLLDAHLRDVQRFVESDLAARVDLLRTDVQRADAEQRLNSARNAVDLSKSAFNNLLDRRLDKPVKVEDVLKYEARVITVQEASEAALEQRPELRALEAAVEVAERSVSMARADYYPTVAARGTYDWQKGTQLEILDDGWHWTVGVSASMSLWNWGATRARVAQARARAEQTRLNLDKARDGVALEVRQAFLKMGEAEKNVAVSEKAVVSAQESYRTTKERYREGVGTNTDVLDAETALATAEANRYQALFDFNIAVARLEKAIGQGPAEG